VTRGLGRCRGRRRPRIAALVTGGVVQAAQLDELVADAISHFLRGSRAAA
jgi:hypothetical protein